MYHKCHQILKSECSLTLYQQKTLISIILWPSNSLVSTASSLQNGQITLQLLNFNGLILILGLKIVKNNNLELLVECSICNTLICS